MNNSIVLMFIKNQLIMWKRTTSSLNLKMDILMIKRLNELQKLIDYSILQKLRRINKILLEKRCILIADVFEKFIKVSIKDFDVNPLYCVSLQGYTCQCGLK